MTMPTIDVKDWNNKKVGSVELSDEIFALEPRAYFGAIIFKVLPDAHIAWRNVWIGAFVTALLFVLGQIGLGIYFSISEPGANSMAAKGLTLAIAPRLAG